MQPGPSASSFASYSRMFAFTAQVLVAFSAALLLGIAGRAQPTSTCARQYTVQSGDFCDGISAAQNVSTFQIAHVNQGIINSDCSNLFIGEPLCLGITGQDCSTVHVVVENDNCVAIAAAAGISFATLTANNPNVDAACTNIYPGEVLCTASAVINYT